VRILIASALALFCAAAASAQTGGHDHAAGDDDAAHHGHATHQGHAASPAFLGPYPRSREGSGTSWLPDASEHEGVHGVRGAWSLMAHGFVSCLWDEQGGPRGGDKLLGTSMLMGMATRPLGPGRLGLRAMLSLDPATVGREGYPLLLQSGETADGRTHLIDRQHPHDLFMEMAATYSVTRGRRSAFIYAALPGEPALGPPVFMHRPSGAEIPEAPIAHHWLDSSHITYGVVTLGAVDGRWKLEGSLFKGREPDQARYGIEAPELDSRSVRLSWNPSRAWALQLSHGRLVSPEQLEPGIDVDRTTASAIWSRASGSARWHATLAWGRNRNRPGRTLDAFLLETTVSMRARHGVFARGEIVEKDELFEEQDPLHGRAFTVGKVSVGYLYDFMRTARVAVAAGASGGLHFTPGDLKATYGDLPASGIVFLRMKLR
jgi:hypothetical protein